MKVHVLIISYARPHFLHQCLLSLKNLSPLDFQVHLLLNGKDEASSQIAKMISERMPYKMQIFESPKKSLAAARNFLLNEVKDSLLADDWILFLDDDVFLPAGYGGKAIESLGDAREKQADLVGGPNLTPVEASFQEKISGEWLASFFASGPMSLRYRIPNSERKVMKTDYGLILCHLWVSAGSLKKHLFLNRIQGGEENLFFEKFFKNSGKALYDGELFLFHHRRRNFKCFFQQIYKYGYGRGQVFKYSHRVQLIYLLPVLFFLFLLVCLGAGYLFPFSVTLVIYLGLLLLETMRIMIKTSQIQSFVSVLAIPVMHMTYSVGLLAGWLNRPLLSSEAPQANADLKFEQ